VNPSRRNFIRGAISGAAGTALAGGVLIGGAKADADAATAATGADGQVTEPSYSFHGARQAGILTPDPAAKQPFTCVAAFDSTAGDKAGLTDLLRTLTGRARFLTSGGTPPDLGVSRPPPDSDVLGPSVPADGLTVTLSVGSSLFDDRYGLAASKPLKLTPMRTFPNDSLEPAWLHGDLLVQLCANHPDTIHHTIRDITRHTRGAMALRWKMEGYNSPPRPSGTSRNLLGFKDGTANPTGGRPAPRPALVWVDDAAEPAWRRAAHKQIFRCSPGG
jgi:deferrochelatase/peroxidase EfeB